MENRCSIGSYLTMKLLFRSVLFLAFLSPYIIFGQIPSFSAPDTVCVNSPVSIVNTSVSGTTFFWSFCDGDLNQVPQTVNLGNIGGLLSQPVFMDIVSDNNNFYGFIINHYPGDLIRLDFGNSMLNTPVATSLGNFGGIINAGFGTEGIQVVKNNGNWYAIIVGGDPASSSVPKIVQVNFGPVVNNPAPVATDWGNLGNLLQPIGLYVFNENGNWYGFTVNAVNNTITRFDFGSSFDVPPNATNLGNPGGFFNYPTSLYALKDNGNWHIFITNAGSNSLERLDFGNSLLNTPTPVNIGNPGNVIQSARDIKVIQLCNQVVGFVVDGLANALVKLDFNNDMLSIPTAQSLGNIGNFNFPHSLSKLFRVGPDLYSFIPNVNNNTLSRVRFAGCNSSSLTNSALQNPAAISYSQTGTYHINMVMDDGLATQSSFCKSIVVGAPTIFSLGKDTAICQGDSISLAYPDDPSMQYHWQDGSTSNSYTIHSSGQYELTISNKYQCSSSHSVNVNVKSLPVVKTLPDTAICMGTSLVLSTLVQDADSVNWAPGSGLSDPMSVNPVASPDADIRYMVTAWHQNCPMRDTVLVNVRALPVINISQDTLVCVGGTVQLRASGAGQYLWYPADGLSDPTSPDPLAHPASSIYYHVLATDDHLCTARDSVFVKIKSPSVFSINGPPAGICPGDSARLTIKGADESVGDTYQWISDDIGQQDPAGATIIVSPSNTSTYQVVGIDPVCGVRDTLTAEVRVLERPSVTLTKSNDIDCILGEATLTASGGVQYNWSPPATLSHPDIANPVARADSTTLYWVNVTGENGCSTIDSIRLNVTKGSGSIGFPVANAFTPNGDGVNDCFGIKYWGYIARFEMAVFNRWGERVFYSQNPDQCWDGSFKGKMQSPGTFVYYIKALTLCGDVIRKGTVLLIR